MSTQPPAKPTELFRNDGVASASTAMRELAESLRKATEPARNLAAAVKKATEPARALARAMQIPVTPESRRDA